MLGYVALLFLCIFCIKLPFQLAKHKQLLSEHGISRTKIIVLQFSSLLYIVSFIGYILPFQWLDLIRPIPTGFLLLLPGILIGRMVARTMDIGLQAPAQASKVASNIMWLGIGTGIFIMANIILSILFNSLGSDVPL